MGREDWLRGERDKDDKGDASLTKFLNARENSLHSNCYILYSSVYIHCGDHVGFVGSGS